MALNSTSNGTNSVHRSDGYHGSNGFGSKNGIDGPIDNIRSSSMKTKIEQSKMSPGKPAPLATAKKHPALKADREGVTTALNRFAQLVHAPRRPMPTQSGSTTASVRRTQTGLKTDLKFIGMKGQQTAPRKLDRERLIPLCRH